jgi:hypothetical protein
MKLLFKTRTPENPAEVSIVEAPGISEGHRAHIDRAERLMATEGFKAEQKAITIAKGRILEAAERVEVGPFLLHPEDSGTDLASDAANIIRLTRSHYPRGVVSRTLGLKKPGNKQPLDRQTSFYISLGVTCEGEARDGELKSPSDLLPEALPVPTPVIRNIESEPDLSNPITAKSIATFARFSILMAQGLDVPAAKAEVPEGVLALIG